MLSIYCCGLPVGSGYKSIRSLTVKLGDCPSGGHGFSF